jgi:probable F420-dependent oxidoreductase
VKFALILPHMMRIKDLTQPWEHDVTGADQARAARRLDELGYDQIFVPEHFVVPDSHVEFSGPHWLHSTVGQAFLAGCTERIRVATLITLLPLQHPAILAKALSTADSMSGGRITVTFGVGWDAEEFGVLGVPFSERGRIADEYLEAIVELWTSEAPSYDGKYVSFNHVSFEPKPVQKPHLPIWIAGDVNAALKRAARFGSGWAPYLTTPEEVPQKLDFIKSQPGYDGRPFDVLYSVDQLRLGAGHVVGDTKEGQPGKNAQQLIDQLGMLSELGVTFTMPPVPQVQDLTEYLDYAQWVIEEVKPKVP